jgi:hypothetical protein
MPAFIVVSDKVGFVGAFTEPEEAAEALKGYPTRPFVYASWPCAVRPETGAPVWVIPYSANNVVACASTDKAVAVSAQAALLRLDLVPPDDVKYWEARVGEIVAAARRRFEEEETPGGGESLEKRDQAVVDRFIQETTRLPDFLTENKRVSILEGVVPRGHAEEEAAVGGGEQPAACTDGGCDD